MSIMPMSALLVHAWTPTLLPIPAEMSSTGAIVTFSHIQFHDSSSVSSDVVRSAFIRYSKLIGADTVEVAPKPLLVDVSVASRDPSPLITMDTDESYELSLNASLHAVISSATSFGALRGLETLSQLVQCSASAECTAPSIRVRDEPRFPYRGLLVDVARRYLPMPLLHAVVDSMSYAKLNVLHIHATDDQSWPVALSSQPALANHGAFSPTHVYTVSSLRDLVEYARLRGVRVLLEIDTPGHCASLAFSRPDVLTHCPHAAHYGLQYGTMDPTKNTTYALLSDGERRKHLSCAPACP